MESTLYEDDPLKNHHLIIDHHKSVFLSHDWFMDAFCSVLLEHLLDNCISSFSQTNFNHNLNIKKFLKKPLLVIDLDHQLKSIAYNYTLRVPNFKFQLIDQLHQ